MQTANNVVTGQAQGNNGDQDDINNGANDGDEEWAAQCKNIPEAQRRLSTPLNS